MTFCETAALNGDHDWYPEPSDLDPLREVCAECGAESRPRGRDAAS